MTATRMEAAETVAQRHLKTELPEGTALVHMREWAFKRVHWVLFGGQRPAGRPTTEFTVRIIIEAVNAGLAHAYGDTHRGEIPAEVYTRRDSD